MKYLFILIAILFTACDEDNSKSVAEASVESPCVIIERAAFQCGGLMYKGNSAHGPSYSASSAITPGILYEITLTINRSSIAYTRVIGNSNLLYKGE